MFESKFYVFKGHEQQSPIPTRSIGSSCSKRTRNYVLTLARYQSKVT